MQGIGSRDSERAREECNQILTVQIIGIVGVEVNHCVIYIIFISPEI